MAEVPTVFTPTCVKREGGQWLGAVRSRVQTMFRNGEKVTWGSADILLPYATIKDIEELAAVAVAADRNNRKNI